MPISPSLQSLEESSEKASPHNLSVSSDGQQGDGQGSPLLFPSAAAQGVTTTPTDSPPPSPPGLLGSQLIHVSAEDVDEGHMMAYGSVATSQTTPAVLTQSSNEEEEEEEKPSRDSWREETIEGHQPQKPSSAVSSSAMPSLSKPQAAGEATRATNEDWPSNMGPFSRGKKTRMGHWTLAVVH